MPTVASPKGIFVTATDTGVGKTVVSAALALHFRLRGYSVGVLKPVTSGSAASPDGPVSEDAELLRWASGCSVPREISAPYVLRAPIAPMEAAISEGVTIGIGPIRQAFAGLAAEHDLVIVEGAGGLLVPLAPGLLVADLPSLLGLPLLIVARPGLGTVNHTLMTCECALSRRIGTMGIVINGMDPSPGPAEESAPRLISRFTPVPLLGVLPRLAASGDRGLVERLSVSHALEPVAAALAREVNLERT